MTLPLDISVCSYSEACINGTRNVKSRNKSCLLYLITEKYQICIMPHGQTVINCTHLQAYGQKQTSIEFNDIWASLQFLLISYHHSCSNKTSPCILPEVLLLQPLQNPLLPATRKLTPTSASHPLLY